ncbi:PINIT domain-containing protein [Phascolomyces articulosus]|uniref:PINIT domain-containing protein n=1 Tax=Phascolomyces articulosus TaxID=60185 RepID=A0AAD5PL02_9FUNG|nr:PINIT domain-containing protein [Phascolomyces articulosus]
MDYRNVDRPELVETTLRLPLTYFRVVDLKEVMVDINSRLPTHSSARLSPTGNKLALINRITLTIVGYIKGRQSDQLNRVIQKMNSLERRYHWIQKDGKLEARMGRALPVQIPNANMQRAQQYRVPLPQNRQPTFVSLLYKHGPYFETVHEITRPVLCSVSVHGRAQRTFTFTLSGGQQQLINNGGHEIRIFCSKFRGTNQPQIIEFPDICDIKVNGVQVLSGQNFRGIKGNPGTIHPPDVTRHLNIASSNKIEMIYAASGSEFAACIRLVRRHSVESLVQKLINKNTVSKDEILKQFRKQKEEADIVVEFESISMRCPLGFTRIQTPIRSKMCSHAQCFEAFTFLKMNEQTPTWSCPACYKSIASYDDLIVDGYFKDILNTVGQHADTVRIGPSGEVQQVKEEPDVSDAASSTSASSSHPTNNRLSSATADTAITIIDDDNEDDDAEGAIELRGVKRPASEELPTRDTPPAQRRTPANFIDLTLSDDEDENGNDVTMNNNNHSNNNNNKDNNNNNNTNIIQLSADNIAAPAPAPLPIAPIPAVPPLSTMPAPSINSFQGQPRLVVLTPQQPQIQPLPAPNRNPPSSQT